MATTLELMYNLRREIVVITDLDIDLCSDDTDIKTFKELCDRFQLTNTIEKPTRVTESTATLLDLICSIHPDHYVKSGSPHLGISDHDLRYIVRKQRLPKPSPKHISYRSRKKFEIESFICELKNVPWESAYMLPKVRSTKHGFRSFRYFAAKTWNALPDSFHAMAGTREFLRSIRYVAFKNCYYCSYVAF